MTVEVRENACGHTKSSQTAKKVNTLMCFLKKYHCIISVKGSVEVADDHVYVGALSCTTVPLARAGLCSPPRFLWSTTISLIRLGCCPDTITWGSQSVLCVIVVVDLPDKRWYLKNWVGFVLQGVQQVNEHTNLRGTTARHQIGRNLLISHYP